MAVVATYQGADYIVRVHDDDLAEDQQAAWAEARKIAASIYYRRQMEALQQKEARNT